MKNQIKCFIALLFIVITFPDLGFAQEDIGKELDFEVNRIYRPFSISKEKIDEAKTLTDLNDQYEESWVKEYISVEIFTSNNGKVKTAISKNNILTQQQKANLKSSDLNSEIKVLVRYLPENTLSHNEIKKNDFTLLITPDVEAQYPGGQKKLEEYLKANAIDKISENSFKNYDLVIVKFTIDPKGNIINTHLFSSSENEKTNELLLNTIRNMPRWKSGEYSNGIKVEQEFALTVGSMENCMVALLNIRRN